MARAGLALLLASIAVTAAWAQDDAGTIANPGFELGDENRAEAWGVGGGAAIVRDAAIAHSGQRCAMTRFEDSVAQRVKIDGAAAYRISGWIRRVDPAGIETPKIKVYFYDAEGKQVDVQAAECPGAAADWSSWETVMQAPFNAAEMNLTVRGFFGGTKWFYWDDFAMQKVEAPDWPRWDDTPDLDGMTVTVPDIADVWTDALLRWPPNAIVPFDGRLDSSVLLRGESLRVELQGPIDANWALIHTMRPGMALGEALLMGRGPADLEAGPAGMKRLAPSEAREELVTSLQFEPQDVDTALLMFPFARDAEVYLNEIQLFGLTEGAQLPGDAVELRLAEGAPEAVADDLAAAFAAEGQRAALTAGEATGGEYELPAGRYTSIFAQPAQGEFGLAGVTLDLALPGASEGDMIEIALKRPEELDINVRWTTLADRQVDNRENRRYYSDLCRVVSRVEGGRLRATLDVPDQLYPADEPIWLTIRARREMTLDLAQSRLIASTISPDAALAEYVPQIERVLRRMYADATEAHVYDGRDWSKMVIGAYTERVLALAPGNGPATQIYQRIARVKPVVRIERPGPAYAPDWAVWAREAMQNRHEILTWWLNHRQQANGELGGHINDDGEYSCNWPSVYLMTGDERIANALRKLSDVAWEMSAGTGYTVGSRDVEHAAEDQSCTQPQVLLTDYGNPTSIERFMTMSQYFDLWTHVNEAGRRQFRSYMFNTKEVWDDPPFDIDQPYCPLSMVGTGHLVWYNGSPEISRIFLEEAESWALACLSTDKGKPEGKIPIEISARTSEINPYAPYPSNPILQKRNSLYRGGAGAYIVQYFMRGAFALTNDDPWRRLVGLWEPPADGAAERAESTLARYSEQVPPPPAGPEQRYAVPATEYDAIKAPLEVVRGGEAIGGQGTDANVGSVTCTISVPEAGRYAIWGLLGRADPTEEGTQDTSFFATVDDRPRDRLRGPVPADEWTPLITANSYELAAGEHTILVGERTNGSALREIGFTNKYSLEGSWRPSQDELSMWRAWRVTGDRKWLVEELRECVRQQERNRWLLTEAEPYTDRVPVPGQRLLSSLFLGDFTSGKSHVPGHWVSWEGGGLDYAAAVREASPEHLKALVYSFHEQPTPMTMRVWRLPHGRYRVSVGADTDGDDVADRQVTTGEQELWRYDGAVQFDARPGETLVIELTLLEELPDIRMRPDLAIGVGDATVDGDALTVTVHNIGGSAAPASTLQVLGAAGEIATAQVPALDAPIDLKPKTVTVRIDLPEGAQATTIRLDPTNAIAEITEANNALRLRN